MHCDGIALFLRGISSCGFCNLVGRDDFDMHIRARLAHLRNIQQRAQPCGQVDLSDIHDIRFRNKQPGTDVPRIITGNIGNEQDECIVVKVLEQLATLDGREALANQIRLPDIEAVREHPAIGFLQLFKRNMRLEDFNHGRGATRNQEKKPVMRMLCREKIEQHATRVETCLVRYRVISGSISDFRGNVAGIGWRRDEKRISDTLSVKIAGRLHHDSGSLADRNNCNLTVIQRFFLEAFPDTGSGHDGFDSFRKNFKHAGADLRHVSGCGMVHFLMILFLQKSRSGSSRLDIIQYRRRYSRSVIIQMLLIGAIAIALILWQFGNIKEIYLNHDISAIGIIINGAIAILFLMGVFRIILSLLGYAREERSLNRFIRNMQEDPENPLLEVPASSMISRRYMTMQRLYESRTPINHGALASALLARESTRVNLPRYINNILILLGVFGTIISLSIALLGASDMLESSIESGGMGLVIHGMSTALSTTMTAIACYLYFGYFYLKLTNVQTNLMSGIEQTTTAYLSPKFQVTNDNIIYEFTGLLRMLQQLIKKMEASHKQFMTMEQAMAQAAVNFKKQTEAMPDDLQEVKAILRDGFRLESRKDA